MEQFIQDLFVTVLNMSITASYVILFVSIARLFLKKAPKMYALRSYLIPEAVVNAIVDGKKTTMQSIQDIPVGVEYKVLRFGNEVYYIYAKGGNYYCEQPYQFIKEITEVVYKKALEFAENPSEVKNATVTPEIISLVEDRLTVIMSSPQHSSNPGDYVLAHQNAYDEILKYGGEEALSYMLSQIEQGKADGLRGHLMMGLCKELKTLLKTS